MAKSMKQIAELLGQVKFKRRLLGGVDELDVWDTLEALQKEYRELVQADRNRLLGLLHERDERIAHLTDQLARQQTQLEAAARALQRAGLAGGKGDAHGG